LAKNIVTAPLPHFRFTPMADIDHRRIDVRFVRPIADVIKRTPNEAVYRRATVIATARTISQESAPIHPAESASHSNAPLGKRFKPNQLKPTSSEERTSTLTF
jgi:hypothetical protein